MISLNTNMTSLIVQRNLNKATEGLNRCIEQLTTGYKINHAKDNAANYSIMKNMESKLSAWDVATDNISIGYNMLETACSTAELITNHVMRIRDLCEQACNGTYGEASIRAIQAEIEGRLEEINRIKNGTEFNGIKIFEKENPISIQVGINSSSSSMVSVQTKLNAEGLNSIKDLDITNPSSLEVLDDILDDLNTYQTKIGASQNRLTYALDYAEVMKNNLSSSLSTIRDADIAKVSSDFIRYQILQQASATLLATANQQPALALQLLGAINR